MNFRNKSKPCPLCRSKHVHKELDASGRLWVVCESCTASAWQEDWQNRKEEKPPKRGPLVGALIGIIWCILSYWAYGTSLEQSMKLGMMFTMIPVSGMLGYVLGKFWKI